jgi:hypothetical protein
MAMSIGTVLVGIALLIVLVAYVARPFRTATEGVDPETAIEFWVAQIREEQNAAQDTGQSTGPGLHADRINYCPACGRRVSSNDRYCSGCGTRLRGGEA